MEGVVKWYNEKKGFGFIVGEDNNEYFIHVSKLLDDKVIPKENDKARFLPKDTIKGKQAFDIKIYNEGV